MSGQRPRSVNGSALVTRAYAASAAAAVAVLTVCGVIVAKISSAATVSNSGRTPPAPTSPAAVLRAFRAMAGECSDQVSRIRRPSAGAMAREYDPIVVGLELHGQGGRER